MGANALKNQYSWWGLAFFWFFSFKQRPEGDLHQDNFYLLAFDLVRQSDGYCKGRKTAEKTCGVRRTLGSVLIYVHHPGLPVDDISHDTPLISSFGRNDTESSRADLPITIADDVGDHFLPAVLTRVLL